MEEKVWLLLEGKGLKWEARQGVTNPGVEDRRRLLGAKKIILYVCISLQTIIDVNGHTNLAHDCCLV